MKIRIIPIFRKANMARQNKYHSLNRDVFMQTAQSFSGSFTAKELADALEKGGNSMSISTIYRLLDDFVAGGELHKTYTEDNNAKFYYLAPCENENHFYLECEKCNSIQHVDCKHLQKFSKHISKKHNFKITNCKLIINGICDECSE